MSTRETCVRCEECGRCEGDDDDKMALVEGMRPRMTYADLEQLPEDGRRYELYDGEVRVVPSPIPLHQLVAHRLADELKAYAQECGGLVFLAPLDIVFSELNTAQPDVVFFVRDRVHLINLRKAIRVPPDLAVEVLSPSTAAVDRGRKMQMFARFGVGECWLIDLESRTIEIYQLSAGACTLRQTAKESEVACSTVLPGFTLRVGSLLELLG